MIDVAEHSLVEGKTTHRGNEGRAGGMHVRARTSFKGTFGESPLRFAAMTDAIRIRQNREPPASS